MTQDTHTIWVCVDCLHVHANGETGGEPDRDPLCLLDGMEVTLGMMSEDHHEDCDFRNSRAARDAEEIMNLPERTDVYDCNLNCETDEFSTHPCEGCGSTLGGSRHAVTVWEEDE